MDSDRPFLGNLRLASPARAYLGSMHPSRARSGVARTLSRREIEERLDETLRRGGPSALLRLRDDSRKLRSGCVCLTSFNGSTPSLVPCSARAPLVAEVHPFADGNGRVARMMMNAELVAAGESRIIVPTIYRSNYLMASKALSHNGMAGALARTMDFAQRYTAAVDFAELDTARLILDRTHAFYDPDDAETDGVRLLLPPLTVQ